MRLQPFLPHLFFFPIYSAKPGFPRTFRQKKITSSSTLLLIDHHCDWHESLGFRGLGGIQDLRGRVALAVALQEEL